HRVQHQRRRARLPGDRDRGGRRPRPGSDRRPDPERDEAEPDPRVVPAAHARPGQEARHGAQPRADLPAHMLGLRQRPRGRPDRVRLWAMTGAAYPGPVPTVSSWLREHPWQADGLLAVALFAVSVPQLSAGSADAPARAAYVAVTVLLAASRALRRRWPVAACTVAAAVAAVQAAVGGTARRAYACLRPAAKQR